MAFFEFDSSGTITATKIKVNRHSLAVDVFRKHSAVGITFFSNGNAFKRLPLHQQVEATLVFIPISRAMSKSEFSKFMADHRIVADPVAQAAFNIQNPTFHEKYPNTTQWSDVNFGFSFAYWVQHDGQHEVGVDVRLNDWEDYWYVCGAPI